MGISCNSPGSTSGYDILISNGTLYDGNRGEPYHADIGIVGATTVRIHELGYEDRALTAEELERMRQLVRQAMDEGSLGLGSSLIYAPAFYAGTSELVELAKVVGEYNGMYISHLRSEGNQLLEAVDELIHIAREANIPAEIYHLKAAGSDNWQKFDEVVTKVEAARAKGLHITADMYTYTAGSTGQKCGNATLGTGRWL